MVKGFKDANLRFHPISPSKGISRSKRLGQSELSDAHIGVKINKTMHNEGLRLRRTHQLRGDKSKILKNLEIIEEYYIDKKGSLAEREIAISNIKKWTGHDPRMFGNTDGDVLRGIREIKKQVKTERLRRVNVIKDPKNKEWGFDLTDFKKGQFKDVLKGLGIAEGDVTDDIGEDLDGKPYKRGFVWHGEGIEITTGNNPITGQYSNPNMKEPEVDYASYIGITGLPDQVDMAVKLIKKHGDFIKGESKNMRDFI